MNLLGKANIEEVIKQENDLYNCKAVNNKYSFKLYKNNILTYNGYFYLDAFPTMNCQFYSIGCMNIVLLAENPLELLKIAQNKALKKMMLVDIHQGAEEARLEEIFPKEHIVIKSPYTSTNGSKMVLYLILTTLLQ